MVFTYIGCMKQKKQENENVIPISEFKAKCLKLLDETGKKGREYTITKKGEPIAKVIPIKKKTLVTRRGSLKGLARIHGDIVNVTFEDDWEVLKP